MSARRVVAIVGPTASGKSDLAMAVARRLSGEIVSCDSVQVYRGLDIGSGKPSRADRAEVAHHLIDILDIEQEMNAAMWAEQAAGAISEIAARGRTPIVTGGTGLYLTALVKGLFDQGPSSAAIRTRLERLADRHGASRLHRLLSVVDNAYAEKTRASDRIRIVRALEVAFTMRRPFSELQRERRPAFSGQTLLIGLDPGREALRRRVEARVSGMLSAGLVGETRRALGRAQGAAHPPRPLGAIGYREVVLRLAGEGLPPSGDRELQRAIVTSTMQYAKRQMTYFRHQFEVEWFEDGAPALERIAAWLAEEEPSK